MRKFLLILLNVLCLSASFSQVVLTAKRQSSRMSPADSFKPINQILWKYDNKICRDTLISEEYYFSDNNGQYRNTVTTRVKYDAQIRLIESERTTIQNSKGLTATDTFKVNNTTINRVRYVYTAANVRADTFKYDSYDVNTKTWSTSSVKLLRKAGFGYDTVKTANAYIVYDNKGRIIIEAYNNDGKNTSDSTSYKFDAADRYLGYDVFSNNYGYTKLIISHSTLNVYSNNKLTKRINTGYGSDTTTITTDFYYKNDLPDYEQTVTKNVRKSITNVITVDSTITRLRYVSFNAANRCIENINEQYSNGTKAWLYIGGNKMVYQNDTLLLRDTLTANGRQTLSVYEYGTCSQTVSDVNEVMSKIIDFNLAPNPTTGLLNLSLSEEIKELGVSVSVYNIQGSEVYNSKITSEATTVDLSNLSKGFYLVKVADKTHSTVKKLVLN